MFTILILVILIAISYCQNDFDKNWQQHLSNCISNKIKPHQVVILKEQNSSRIVEDLVSEIRIKTPIWAVDIDNPNLGLKNSRLLQNPGTTTVFIVIHEADYHVREVLFASKIQTAFDFIANLSGVRMRPKCLILHLTIFKEYMYETLLKELWQKKFLNIDIIRIVKTDITNVLKPSLVNMITLHSFNPFTNVSSKEKFSSQTDLFPDKLRNLQGYELKLGERRSLIKRKINPGAIPSIISKALNFSVNYRILPEISGNGDLIGETRLMEFLKKGEYDFIKYPRANLGRKDSDDYEVTSFITPKVLVSVVPILIIENGSRPIKLSFIFAAIFIISLMLLLWIVSRLLKLSAEFSHPMFIVQLIFGLSTSYSPRKLQEKILFIFIRLLCITYSCWVFLEMTQILMHSQEELDFSTIEEVSKSCLVPVFRNYLDKQIVEIGAEEDEILLLNKSLVDKGCIRMLEKYKNVSCIYPEDVAKTEMQKQINSKRQMKIVEEKFLLSPRSLILAPGSPYVTKFDDLILRIQETGLKKKRDTKWSQKVTATNIYDLKSEVVKKVEMQFLIFILIGHMFSVLVFIAEMIIAKYLTNKTSMFNCNIPSSREG